VVTPAQVRSLTRLDARAFAAGCTGTIDH